MVQIPKPSFNIQLDIETDDSKKSSLASAYNNLANANKTLTVTNGGTGTNYASVRKSLQMWSDALQTHSIKLPKTDTTVYLSTLEIADLYEADQELTQLCDEIPAVREKFDELQMLVKLYRRD